MLFFLYRLLRVAALAVLIIVLAQDLFIFPQLWLSWFSSTGSPPRGVLAFFTRTADLKKLETWYLPPEVQGARKKTALIFHGNAGTVQSFFPIQRWFSSLGIPSYDFDFRGFGNSSGWPSERGLERDAEAVYAEMVKREGDPGDVVIFGISVGTGPAAYLAAKVKPKILVLLSPYTSMSAAVHDQGVLGVLAPLLRYRFPSDDYIKNLEGTCLILAHGEADDVIPPRHSKELAAVYPGKVILLLLPETGHNDLFFRAAPMLAQAIAECEK